MRLLAALLVIGLMAIGLAEEEKKEKWDVANPPGEVQKVPLKVNTGTWMSLDVSPDGKSLAFDLLGDLYLLDLGTGKTSHLTSGMEWDMQPAFSPDGRQLAFTSDRGGGDNIWVLDLAKGEASARAISKESFRLLNQPVWDPAGDYIAARKHFTDTRSLGAGEIWAYHVDGKTEGVQLTKRPNDQLDLGEPAFSPDGRYLYFSRDATSGETFQYNKDPNAGIYVIDRLDRVSGKTVGITGGSGGACAPTPSPDGQWLAFVRRIRGKSVLMLHRLSDGFERPLFDGMERDMQETWAIHGVYPRMAWTPDSKELLFWAQGRLWRLTALDENAKPREIPFAVDDHREVREAIRFPVQVAPQGIAVRALSNTDRSSSGSVVFAALGRIWLKTGSASPRPLGGPEGRQSCPKFVSPSEILYVHWDDQSLGSIRLHNLTTGAEQVLEKDGRFTEPVLSPDRRYLVYGRLGRSSLFDQRFSHEPGLYLKDLSQASPARHLGDGSRPHFGRDSRVLYYNTGGEEKSLHRRELDTGDTRVLYEGTRVGEILVSPDEKQLAFLQNFQLYVTPFTLTGGTLEVGAKTKEFPVKKVSTEIGAYFPHWAQDGQLGWNVGPHRFSCQPDGSGRQQQNLSWTLASPRSESTLALVAGQVITMQGDTVIPEGTVLVEGDRIKAVGPSSSVPIPPGALTLDCRGKTVMPGLVDVHWHGSFADETSFPEVNWVGLSSLSFGLTTLHDPSNDTASVFTAKEMQLAGSLLAPRIFSTGTILYGAKANGYFAPIDSLDDAEGHLKRLEAWGAHSVKSYNQPRRNQRQQVLEAARQLKSIMVVPEGGSLFQHNMTMVVDGHTGVEHALPVENVYDDVVALWSGTKVGYTPTLGVAYGGVWGENFWYVKTDVWDDDRLNQFVPREVLDPAARRRTAVPDEEYNHKKASAGAYKLSQAGVKVNLGAHGQREGLAVHWELWMLAQGGMSPLEALRCGTLNGAHYLGMDGEIGSLEPGKLADIVVLDKNPLDDIQNSKYVKYTVLGGRVFEAETMAEVAPNPGQPPRVWWR